MGIKSFVKNIAKLLTEEKSSANKTLDEIKILEHGKVKADKSKALNSNDVQSNSINSQAVAATTAAVSTGLVQAANDENIKLDTESMVM